MNAQCCNFQLMYQWVSVGGRKHINLAVKIVSFNTVRYLLYLISFSLSLKPNIMPDSKLATVFFGITLNRLFSCNYCKIKIYNSLIFIHRRLLLKGKLILSWRSISCHICWIKLKGGPPERETEMLWIGVKLFPQSQWKLVDIKRLH